MEHFPNPNSAFFTLLSKLTAFFGTSFHVLLKTNLLPRCHLTYEIRLTEFQNQILVILVDFYGHPFKCMLTEKNPNFQSNRENPLFQVALLQILKTALFFVWVLFVCCLSSCLGTKILQSVCLFPESL